ncbi:MAG: DNA primase [Oscillospiraceae bacterium]|nr:DNA primase [Oscillospiraceae bacterium]
MAFPQPFIDELIARSDIVDVVGSYVNLSQKAGSYWGCCPFHSEKTPSFHVLPDRQFYHCFGCHKGGGVINFIMEIENLSYPDAVRFLAKRANMEVPEDTRDDSGRLRKRILELNREAARFYYDLLQKPEGEAVRAYLDRRQIRRSTAVRFGMGAAPDSWDTLLREMTSRGYTKTELISAGLAVQNKNGRLYDKFRNRLMLPVIDVRGDVTGFTSRVLDKSEPKYLNTPETMVFAKRRTVYALNLAKKTQRPNLILCEGNLDVVTLHQAGFDNAVATMGTALTPEHLRLLSRYTKELVLCFDNDAAGQQATQRALEMLNNTEFSVKVLHLPNRIEDGVAKKQDADDFIRAYGAAAFENLLKGSAGGMDFTLAQVAGRYDLTSDEQRVAYAAEISGEIAKLHNAVEREIYTARAAQAAGLTAEALGLEVKRAIRRRIAAEKKKQERRELNPAVSLQPRERGLRYENLRSAMAEEGLIRLLLQDPGLFKGGAPVSPEDFSSPLLSRIYARLWQDREDGYTPGVARLAGELTAEEMNHLTAIAQKPESAANGAQALADYAAVITEEKEKRGDAQGDPLAAAVRKYKQNKGYGGKRND